MSIDWNGRSFGSTRNAKRFAAIVAGLGLAGVWNVAPVLADTTGGVGSSIPAVPNPFPAAHGTTPAIWGYIGNEHILVSMGYINTLSLSTPSITLTVAGRMSFGTTGGSRQSSADNNQPLSGHNYDASGILSVWPYANSWVGTLGLLSTLDYPAYLQAVVDGETTNVGYDSAKAVTPPFFDRTTTGPVLSSEYTVGANDVIRIRTAVKVLRSTARIEWTITNDDTIAHNVGLRYAINQRAVENNLYYVDPDRGATNQTTVYDGSKVPSQIEVFGRRAEKDLNDVTTPPFHSRWLLRGNGATEPSKVWVADSFDLYAGEAAAPTDNYLPQTTRNTKFSAGLAVAAYFGGDTGYVLRPGESRTVVTYYGLGTSTEQFANDLVLGTEAPTALQFNSSAALDPAVAGNTSATVASIGAKFLTPNPFQVFASAYSQKASDPEFDVPFNGVSLSLNLPSGLKLGTVPGAGTRDVPTKLVDTNVGTGIGKISGDQEGSASWFVEPTGDRFGPLTYQVSLSVSQPLNISRTVSRTINIPAVPIVELQPNVYQMVGFPFQFDPILSNNGNPDTIVNSLNRPEELNPTFYRWAPDTTGFESGGGRWQVSTKLETGTAYFYRPTIITGNGKRALFLKGAQPTTAQAPTAGTITQPVQITVERGWNMISNPYVYDIPLKYVRVIALENNPDLVSISFGEAVSGGLMKGSIFYFNPSTGGYDFFGSLQDVMKPWQGYWIYSNSKAVLQFATPTLRGSLVQQTAAGSEPATRVVQTADAWNLKFRLAGPNGRVDEAAVIGVGANAKASSDVPKPPAFKDFVSVSIADEAGKGRFAQVVRPNGKSQSWNLVVESDQDGEGVLQWPGMSSLPKRVRLTITDMQTGVTSDLRSAAGIKVALRAGTVTRFRVAVATDATRKLAVSYLRSEPGGRASGAYSYRLGLTQDAEVDAQIVTLSGKSIQTIAAGRATAGNTAKLVWNGRNTDGSSVPVGPYKLIVTVRGTDGSSVTETRTISVVR